MDLVKPQKVNFLIITMNSLIKINEKNKVQDVLNFLDVSTLDKWGKNELKEIKENL